LCFQYEPLPCLKKCSEMLNVKSYDFKKISLHHLNQNITLCHSLISIVVVRRTPHKTGVCALPASAVGEQTWGKKIPVIHYPRGRRYSICNLQVADRTSLTSGVGIPHINHKVEPRPGYQINLRSWATGKKIFTSMERTF
jgi:hypothetical protein